MVATYAMVFLIPAVFYSYTALTMESIFIIDIATFVVAIILGQLFSYLIFKLPIFFNRLEKVAILLIVLMTSLFIVFTFSPPHLTMFQDPLTGQYGLL